MKSVHPVQLERAETTEASCSVQEADPDPDPGPGGEQTQIRREAF